MLPVHVLLLGVIFHLAAFAMTTGYQDGQNNMPDSGRAGAGMQAMFAHDTGAESILDSAEEAIESSQADSLFADTAGIEDTLEDPVTMQDTLCISLAFCEDSVGRPWCYPGGTFVTSPFGERRKRWHYGTDLRMKIGDTVRVAFAGTVRLARNGRRGYGRLVIVRHDNGLETLYGHLHRIFVKNDQRLKAGENIGLGGNTGRSTGPHLHLEVRFRGQAVDPEQVFDFDNNVLKNDTLKIDRSMFAYLIELRKAKYCIVRRGDCLSIIARRYGTTVKHLCELNEITKRKIIRKGDKLRYR